MQRRDFVIFGAACGLLSATAVAAPVAGTALSLPMAINKSGRLRMLSQRSAKAWLLLVQGVLPERGRSILHQSLASFEQILGELKSLQPGDEIRGLAQALEQEWRACRPLLVDIRSDAKAIWTHNEAVLAAAHGALARCGVLATRPEALDTLARATDVVFDKTGTLSDGRPARVAVDVFAELDADAAFVDAVRIALNRV